MTRPVRRSRYCRCGAAIRVRTDDQSFWPFVMAAFDVLHPSDNPDHGPANAKQAAQARAKAA